MHNRFKYMKKLIIPFIIAGSFILYSCTSSQPVNKGTSTNAVLKAESITQGRTLYESNCGKCHDLPAVASFNDEKWKSVIDWMAPKAKLNTQQSEMVLSYVTSSNNQ